MNSSNSYIGISSFVKRQIKGSGKTYSTISFEKIASYANDELMNNNYKNGYRDGVILIPVKKSLLPQFICPIVEINENTKFESLPKKRRENEKLYISTKALNGKPIDIGGIDLILYRKDVLDETDERSTDKEWELIAFHAIPIGFKDLPMGPITMMRNQLQLPGGTKGKYTSEEWAESVNFWQKYALLK